MVDGAGGVLRGGERHHYRIELQEQWFLQLVAMQQGADLRASFYDPDGSALLHVDSPNGRRGPERVVAVAPVTGSYRLELLAQGDAARQGNYEIQLLALRPAEPRDRRLAEAEGAFALAEEERRQGDASSLARALQLYETARSLFATIDEHGRAGLASLRSGDMHGRLGQLDHALAAYRLALPRLQQAQDLRHQAAAINNLGLTLQDLGAIDRARVHFQQSLLMLQQLGDEVGVATALNNLGLGNANEGQPFAALEHYHRALAIWRRLEIHGQQAATLSNIGEVYRSLGEDALAADFLLQALELQEQLGDRQGMAITHSNLGNLQARTRDDAQSELSYRQALALFAQVGDPAGEARTLINLGRLYMATDQQQAAGPPLHRALDIAHERQQPGLEAMAASNLGWLYLESNPARALELQQRAAELFTRLRDGSSRARALQGVAAALQRLGRRESARRELEAALQAVEGQRDKVASGKLRATFFAQQQDLYGQYLDLLTERWTQDGMQGPGKDLDSEDRPEHLSLAFAACQRSRAQELLAGLDDWALGDRVQPARTAEQQQLEQRIHQAQLEQLQAVAQERPKDQLVDISRHLRQLMADLELARTTTLSQARRQDRWARSLEVAQIQRLIDDGSLFLHYELGRKRSYLWLLDREGLQLFTLAPAAQLEAEARRYYALLTSQDRRLSRGPAEQAGRRLGEMLLGPLSQRLSTHQTERQEPRQLEPDETDTHNTPSASQMPDGPRLVISVEGALHLVPFAALSLDALRGPPVLAGHEVVMLPSVAALAALRARATGPEKCQGTLAVVADPVFHRDDQRLSLAQGQAPQPPTDSPQQALTSATDSPTAAGLRLQRAAALADGFPRLLGTRNEARALLAMVPPDQSLALLDFDASRAAVLAGDLRDFRVLHFATHGLLDPKHPELSGLVLSLVDAEGRAIDGFLRQHEVPQLQLGAELVVLSACRTALGKEVAGEGVLGLPRAFLRAGARAVVVSLWPVDDRATSELMTHFYRQLLLHGQQPAAALRQAQLHLARSPTWSWPAYWAGFSLHGDWQLDLAGVTHPMPSTCENGR